MCSWEAAQLPVNARPVLCPNFDVKTPSPITPAVRKRGVSPFPPHAIARRPQHPCRPGLLLVKGLHHPFITWGPAQREKSRHG